MKKKIEEKKKRIHKKRNIKIREWKERKYDRGVGKKKRKVRKVGNRMK